MSPTKAGLMTIPMMAGTLISSVFVGRLVSRLGVWKPFVVAGAIILTAGFAGASTISDTTSYVRIGVIMVFVGLGVGMTMQNLVLAVQNSVSVRDVGAATGMVTFFRSLGGAIGIQSLGLVFENRLTSAMTSGVPDLFSTAVKADIANNPAVAALCATPNPTPAQFADIVAQCPQTGKLYADVAKLQASGGTSLDIHGFTSDAFQHLLASSIGNSIGHLFLIATFVSVLTIVAVALMKSTRLRAKFNLAASADEVRRTGVVTTDADEPDVEDAGRNADTSPGRSGSPS